jgi:hypothetical protein
MGESQFNPRAQDYQGPNVVLDARRRPLAEGDEVILSLRGPVYFRVAQITPALGLNAPPGAMLVHVGAMLTFTAMRGAVNAEFIRVQTAEEAGPTTFKLLDAQPEEPAP